MDKILTHKIVRSSSSQKPNASIFMASHPPRYPSKGTAAPVFPANCFLSIVFLLIAQNIMQAL